VICSSVWAAALALELAQVAAVSPVIRPAHRLQVAQASAAVQAAALSMDLVELAALRRLLALRLLQPAMAQVAAAAVRTRRALRELTATFSSSTDT
jgi:hypothetical protein